MHDELYAIQREAMRAAATNHPESILNPYDLLYGLDWFDSICALAEAAGGSSIYVPSARKIFSKCLEQDARNEMESNTREKRIHARLAKKYGYSEMQMRRILSA